MTDAHFAVHTKAMALLSRFANLREVFGAKA